MRLKAGPPYAQHPDLEALLHPKEAVRDTGKHAHARWGLNGNSDAVGERQLSDNERAAK